MATRTSLTLLALALAGPASAQTYYRPIPSDPGFASEVGFAREFVGGSYIGAPFTRVPRPTEIVPAPWSYGTYGIPTVTGIASAPVAQPTLTVINAGAGAGHRRGRAVGESRAASARIIEVQVPRR